MIVWRGPMQLTGSLVDKRGQRLRFFGFAFGKWAIGLLVLVRALPHELTNEELHGETE